MSITFFAVYPKPATAAEILSQCDCICVRRDFDLSANPPTESSAPLIPVFNPVLSADMIIFTSFFDIFLYTIFCTAKTQSTQREKAQSFLCALCVFAVNYLSLFTFSARPFYMF